MGGSKGGKISLRQGEGRKGWREGGNALVELSLGSEEPSDPHRDGTLSHAHTVKDDQLELDV